MESKDYCNVYEAVDNVAPSTSKDIVDNAVEEANDNAKDREAGINEMNMEIDTAEMVNEIETENNVIQQFLEPLVDNECDILNEQNTAELNKNKNTLSEASFASGSSIELSESTTSQDNTPSSSNDVGADSFSDASKVGGSSSKGETNDDAGISTMESGHCSKERSPNKSKSEDDCVGNASKFRKLKSKVKERNYRSKESSTTEAGDSCNVGDNEDVEMGLESEEATVSREAENCDQGAEINSDGPDAEEAGENDSMESTTTSERELEVEDFLIPACLRKKKPKPNWFVVPEILRREVGSNPLFQYRYYGSLHVVEHFELMYKLEEHQGCVNTLNFNQKGNLLASSSDDISVVIWDWAIGKKNHSFDSGHRSNVFQAKWLPFNIEYLMATCAHDGQVRLLDIRRGISRKIAKHHAPTHKLAIHPDTPHVIISAGEDANVLSIDIRQEKPTKLLMVKDGSSFVELYSISSNPLNSNEFCVAGRSKTVRIYDRRKVTTPLYKLGPKHKNMAIRKRVHVTSAVYNYNGTEVLASYNDDNIYLFDTVSPQDMDFAHKYQGHRNNATLKGVNFFGPKSEFIVSGSDCGNIFIWDKNTEAIVNWMPADEQGVVNCIEPHPHVPILATSGLDFDVKIWVPSCEQQPTRTKLESCVNSNCRDRLRDLITTDFTIDRRELLWVLIRQISHGRSVANMNVHRGSSDRNRDDDDDDDDDSSDYSDTESEDDESRILPCPPS